MNVLSYNECPTPAYDSKMIENDSIVERLKVKHKRLTLELSNIEAALKALEQNPEFVRCLELVAKA